MLLCACTAGAAQAWTPYHAHFSGGPTAPAHYVHLQLDMPSEFHEAQRQQLRDHYEICSSGKEAAALIGEPVEPYLPLPAGGLPERPWVQDIEIYYGAGRGVVVHTFTHHYIDLKKSRRRPQHKGDCGLLKSTTRTVLIRDAAQSCKIPLPAAGSRLEVRCGAGTGEAEYLYRAGLPDEALGVVKPTGETGSAAGRRCRVFGTQEDLQFCVDELNELGGAPMPLLSPYNRTHAGLLLRQNIGNLRYVAQRVVLDIQVGEGLFRVPENGAAESALPPLPADHR
ncbi:hypothetical protein E6C76_10900 [Pseudothauera nasutitermitis]|uniref:Uncharacterized protein n=1 Tax=Pseudothauera nasutitermitis TaxID=2565930 RepID=A0A4S4AWX8_9RHOO|nr:hypothetical protein [Pseudothauera nasutitermitis]THF64565.1 hypothetical protein E6C76_10900 [Pseudothauera nasutitermitis]